MRLPFRPGLPLMLRLRLPHQWRCSPETWCGGIHQIHRRHHGLSLLQRRATAVVAAGFALVAVVPLIRCRHWRHWDSREQRGLLDDAAFVVPRRTE